ncbi:MAG: Do family serine endopeptidase [Sideroxydans sp.]|nr:Do family serine endopeptidase [Sideroxydans sp.]
MRKNWLLFTQAVTVALAVLFVISTLKPELLPSRNGIVTLYQNAPATTPNEAHPAAASLSNAAQKAMPSVVNIFTSNAAKQPNRSLQNDPRFKFFFDEQENPQTNNASLGSGVLVSADGYILTNHHVIEAAEQIEVALADGRKARAHLIGSDPDTDLAVIKIDLGKKLAAITFAQSDAVRIGDMVLAIGNPFGVGETVTMGIVSALKRDHLGLNTFESYIQTDAAINPGNSGGALIDVNGNLIGINSAIYSPNGGSLGIGFAIPVSTAKQTLEQIIQHGSVTRGWLGASVQELTPELIESLNLGAAQGVLITSVINNSPAERAGIRTGDLLLTIDTHPIQDWSTMLDTVSAIAPNTRIAVQLLRDGATLELQLKVGKRPQPRN